MRLFYPEILRDQVDDVDGGGGGGGALPAADDAGGDDAPPAGGDHSDMPATQQPIEDDAGGAAPGADEPPADYEPNYAYKVHDEEREVPEWLKPLVTDADSEAQVRDLLERADGLEHVKASRQTAIQQLEATTGAYQSQTQGIRALSQFVQNKDFQSFFDGLRIPEDDVLRYALTRIQYRNATPEQRQAFDAQRDSTLRMAALEAENQSFRSGAETGAVRQRSQEIDIALARPEVSSAAQAYDARTGKAGSFRQEVVNRGLLHWHTAKRDIPAEQAVSEVLAIFGGTAGQPSPAGAAGGQPGKAAPGVVPRAPQKKPVIPNLAGSGHSPLKRVPKSIADLRKMGQEAN